MTSAIPVVPESAWIQAVFVVLFIVFVIALLNWFSGQQEKWQKFISERDIQYQTWMDKSESRTADQLESVAKTLQKLADKLDAHDDKVDQRINSVAKSPARRK